MTDSTVEYVAYYRVSTREQKKSGLGLEAQKKEVEAFVKSRGGIIHSEYEEIDSGGNEEREILREAVKEATVRKATLVVSRLDRLSRSVRQISYLMSKSLNLAVCAIPHADPFLMHIYAAVAEGERRTIALRTKQALKALRDRGVKLGNPNLHLLKDVAAKGCKDKAEKFTDKVGDMISSMRIESGFSLREIADKLNQMGVPTARKSGGQWHGSTVNNQLKRMAARAD